MGNEVFEVSHVGFAYKGRKPVEVFEDLSCTISKGIVTTLIGANGSGKSTLFSLLTKNLRPQTGQVLIEGEDLAKVKLSQLAKKVAVVHQRNSAPADISVEKLVSYGRVPYRKAGRVARSDEDEQMIARALEVTGLSGLAGRAVSALSDGQMQRAWIAMALAQGTGVLLLDEPTTFLDVRYQLELLDLVRELNEEQHMTIIMVLHDVNQAIQTSDEIVALGHGKILAQGKPGEVVTPELLEQVYGVRLQIVEVQGQPCVLNARAAG